MARTFSCLSGTHTIKRNYQYCEQCRFGFYPRDEFLGLPREGEASEALEKRMADFAINDVYEQAESRWNFHYPHQRSSHQFRQVTRRLAARSSCSEPVLLQGALRPPPESSASVLYVMSDGGMVPTREAGHPWREVKVGTMFRAESNARGGKQPRGCIAQSRYVAVLGNQDEFIAEMQAAYRVEDAHRAARVVYVGDGAAQNWNVAHALCPVATQILDWHHALENGMHLGRLVLGEAESLLLDWRRRLEQLLSTGDVDALVGELMNCLEHCESASSLVELERLVGYYRNNAERMQYARYRAEGLLIGSGAVESAHRHVIQTRMKKAGQHWSAKGAQGMARLRAAYRTAGAHRFYDALSWAHRCSEQLRAYTQRRAA